MYADTDSIVFTVAKGEWEPSLGDYLGELKDEVPLNNITHFVAAGPKNYAYKIDLHDINEILLKVVLNTITQIPPCAVLYRYCYLCY
jgi:hypothetical protein